MKVDTAEFVSIKIGLLFDESWLSLKFLPRSRDFLPFGIGKEEEATQSRYRPMFTTTTLLYFALSRQGCYKRQLQWGYDSLFEELCLPSVPEVEILSREGKFGSISHRFASVTRVLVIKEIWTIVFTLLE
jgi:hypothetical protein